MMNRTDSLRLLVLAAIWGSSFMFMRVLAPILGPLWTAEVRVGVAGLALCGYFIVIRLDCQWKRLWKEYLIVGIINTTIPFVLFAYAALHIPAAYSAIINATTPLWAALFAALWLGERLTPLKLAGVALGIVGVAIATGIGGEPIHGEVALALLACAGAAVCYAIGGVYMKKFVKGAKPMALAGTSQLLSGLVLLPIALSVPMRATPSPTIWAIALVFSLLCSAVAYILYYGLMESVGPTRTLTVTFLIPVFAMFWGVVLLGEPVRLHMILGGAIVIFSTMLVLGFKLPARLRLRASE